ncbi:MAG TPA: hypothetical protein VLW85_18180 [Myxococcales bacterium]|nr:hypothetical protein [Myxococcales bacterium]
MLRSYKGVDWSTYLIPNDFQYLGTHIEPRAWYPMEVFERMGVAILREIARNDLKLVQHFGRVSLDALCRENDNLVAEGDPNESILRFKVLRQSFFDFPALEIVDVYEHEAAAIVSYGMGRVAEEAATYQTMGFFERLLERSGGAPVAVALQEAGWHGEGRTRIQMAWMLKDAKKRA